MEVETGTTFVEVEEKEYFMKEIIEFIEGISAGVGTE